VCKRALIFPIPWIGRACVTDKSGRAEVQGPALAACGHFYGQGCVDIKRGAWMAGLGAAAQGWLQSRLGLGLDPMDGG